MRWQCYGVIFGIVLTIETAAFLTGSAASCFYASAASGLMAALVYSVCTRRSRTAARRGGYVIEP